MGILPMEDVGDFLDWFHQRLCVELAKHEVGKGRGESHTKARPYRLSTQDKERICELWRENWTITEIATEMRRETGTVRYTLRKAKLYE